jgi:ATP-binding cassette subfamily F protein 3
VLVSHDWHLVELVADRLWLVADGTVRPFNGDLEEYRRLLLAPEAQAEGVRDAAGNDRRSQRREAAERRSALEPLRREARRAEDTAQRLSAERQALDLRLAAPELHRAGGVALADAYRRRAELSRLIEEAEAAWLAAEEAIESSVDS